MPTLQGEFGNIVFENVGNDRFVKITTEAAMHMFQKFTVKQPDLILDELGVWSHGSIGRDQKAKFFSIQTPKHLFRKRKNGCVWDPKGKTISEVMEVTLCPIEYQGEQCPDAFYGECLERILGVGNEVRDMFATPEGRAIAAELMRRIYVGLGNSLYNIAWWGQHPIIALADTDETYAVTPEEWEEFKENQDSCGGILTMVDYYKEVLVRDNYQVPIYTDDVDGAKYTGSVDTLFQRVVDGSDTEFRIAMRNMEPGQIPVLLVTPGIFDKYRRELVAQFNNIPDSYQLFLEGKGTMHVSGLNKRALLWDGFAVVCMDSWAGVTDILNVDHHRVLAMLPGAFGLAYDVPSLAQFDGLGLRMIQRLDAPYNGKIYMDTTFKIGTTIIDPKFVTNASLILPKE